jgi:hypothetical protein
VILIFEELVLVSLFVFISSGNIPAVQQISLENRLVVDKNALLSLMVWETKKLTWSFLKQY